MRPIRLEYMNIAGFDPNRYANTQTTDAAGAITLSNTTASDGYAHGINIRNDSATDLSGETVTLVGTDADGRAISETIAGPGASTSVASTKAFLTLTSVTFSTDISPDTVDVGETAPFVSKTIPLSFRNGTVSVQVANKPDGDASWTVQETFDDFNKPDFDANDMIWTDTNNANLAAETTSKGGALTTVPTGIRVSATSIDAGDTDDLIITVTQSDV